MRVLIMAKEGEQSAAATPPTPEAMAEYQKFNEELVKAGVVLEAGRLYPSSQSKRVRFDGRKRTVIDGPFAETKELVAGDWLWGGGPLGAGPPGRKKGAPPGAGPAGPPGTPQPG